jgi:hypothetical protein
MLPTVISCRYAAPGSVKRMKTSEMIFMDSLDYLVIATLNPFVSHAVPQMFALIPQLQRHEYFCPRTMQIIPIST